MWQEARKKWILLQRILLKDRCGDKIVLFLLFVIITLFIYLIYLNFIFSWPPDL